MTTPFGGIDYSTLERPAPLNGLFDASISSVTFKPGKTDPTAVFLVCDFSLPDVKFQPQKWFPMTGEHAWRGLDLLVAVGLEPAQVKWATEDDAAADLMHKELAVLMMHDGRYSNVESVHSRQVAADAIAAEANSQTKAPSDLDDLF